MKFFSCFALLFLVTVTAAVPIREGHETENLVRTLVDSIEELKPTVDKISAETFDALREALKKLESEKQLSSEDEGMLLNAIFEAEDASEMSSSTYFGRRFRRIVRKVGKAVAIDAAIKGGAAVIG